MEYDLNRYCKGDNIYIALERKKEQFGRSLSHGIISLLPHLR